MIKNRTIIEVEVKGRVFRLECSSDSPLADVYEANSMINAYLVERLKAVESKQEEPKSE